MHAHDAARLLVTRHLPGELVLGTPAAADPATYRQDGEGYGADPREPEA